MKKHILILTTIISLLLAGCSSADISDDQGDTDTLSNSKQESIAADKMNSNTNWDATVTSEPEEHKLDIVVTPLNDGKHVYTCRTCNYKENAGCTLNEDYVCTECTWTHEHEAVYVANENCSHQINCKYECCAYTNQEECQFSHYECTICGNGYPWEKDIEYFDGTNYYDKGIYYAQKELNIYKYPDTESEVLGILAVDEGINCIGRVIIKDDNFWVTEDGKCILNTFHPINALSSDLREGKTTQLVVKSHTSANNRYSAGVMHGVFDSYDEALQNLSGVTWTYIKENWTFVNNRELGSASLNYYFDESANRAVNVRDDGTIQSYYPVRHRVSLEQPVVYYVFY